MSVHTMTLDSGVIALVDETGRVLGTLNKEGPEDYAVAAHECLPRWVPGPKTAWSIKSRRKVSMYYRYVGCAICEVKDPVWSNTPLVKSAA